MHKICSIYFGLKFEPVNLVQIQTLLLFIVAMASHDEAIEFGLAPIL